MQLHRKLRQANVQVAIRRCAQRDQDDATLDPLPTAPSSRDHTTAAHSSLAVWIAETAALRDFHGSLQQTLYTEHAAPYHVQMNPVINIITN